MLYETYGVHSVEEGINNLTRLLNINVTCVQNLSHMPQRATKYLQK